LAVTEIRALDSLERIGQIEQAASRRQFQHSERACHAKPFVACDPEALAVIHKNQIGRDG
jgi:hypothetical protein